MEELKCFICGEDLEKNLDYETDKNQPPFICKDKKCDKENRIIL